LPAMASDGCGISWFRPRFSRQLINACKFSRGGVRFSQQSLKSDVHQLI
jgi:hypothetical protein